MHQQDDKNTCYRQLSILVNFAFIYYRSEVCSNPGTSILPIHHITYLLQICTLFSNLFIILWKICLNYFISNIAQAILDVHTSGEVESFLEDGKVTPHPMEWLRY